MRLESPPLPRFPRNAALDDEEWRLISSLRDIPPSPLRDNMSRVMDALVAFVSNPGCPELQGYGVPCMSAHMACERCRRVLSLLDDMRIRFPRPPLGVRR